MLQKYVLLTLIAFHMQVFVIESLPVVKIKL